jgi:hypothetical protein
MQHVDHRQGHLIKINCFQRNQRKAFVGSKKILEIQFKTTNQFDFYDFVTFTAISRITNGFAAPNCGWVAFEFISIFTCSTVKGTTISSSKHKVNFARCYLYFTY